MTERNSGTSWREPNKWFTARIKYEGIGRAEFSDPVGAITGPARAEFNEAGGCMAATIEVDGFECEKKIESPIGLLHPAAQEPGIEAIHFSGKSNRCTAFVIECPEGTLRSDGNVGVGLGVKVSFGESAGPNQFQFHAGLANATFDTTGAAPVKYWVLPLTNFDSEFRQLYPALHHHPLRVFRTAPPVESSTGQGSALAPPPVWFFDPLIVFDYQGSPGFIEALPGDAERLAALHSHQSRVSVTSVAVGSLGSHRAISREDFDLWPPLDLLGLLSLATGTPVGAAWIELRDMEGRLVRRIHQQCRVNAYSKGHRAINEAASPGSTGKLITQALRSGRPVKDHVRAAMRHVVRGSFGIGTTLEDQMIHLTRGLNCLCEAKNVATQNLVGELALTQAQKVGAILKQAHESLLVLANECNAAGGREQAAIAEKIAARVLNAANVDRAFGLAVCKLLDLSGLFDGEVMNANFSSQPRSGCSTWAGLLSKMRGRVTHRSYLTFGTGPDDIEASDAVSVVGHLHDILLRLVLKELSYDGQYKASIRPGALNSVDWVTTATSADELGYE